MNKGVEGRETAGFTAPIDDKALRVEKAEARVARNVAK
jgi:hypothetical protein